MAPNGCVCGSCHPLWIFDTPASRDSWSALARLSKKSFFFWVFTIKYISRYFTRGWTHGQATAGASHKLRAGRIMDQFCPWTDELLNIYYFHTFQYWLNSLIAKKQWSQQGVDCSAQMGSRHPATRHLEWWRFQNFMRWFICRPMISGLNQVVMLLFITPSFKQLDAALFR